MLTNIFFFLQTARPVLFDQQLVDQMIEDLEKVDLCSIGSHAMLSVSQDETDSELNTECKIHMKPRLDICHTLTKVYKLVQLGQE